MPNKQLKIRVNCLADMNDLLEEYHWPTEVFLPLQVFELINFRSQSNSRGMDNGIPFVWFSGVKLKPPKYSKRTGSIDLSDAEVIDAPP